MDDRTEQLRDLFVETTGERTVTESQRESPGSLLDWADPEETTARQRVLAVVGALRETFDVDPPADDDALFTVVRGYFDGASDAAIADRTDLDRSTVVETRLAMHLVRPSDLRVPVREGTNDGDRPDDRSEGNPVDPETLRDRLRSAERGDAVETVAGEFGARPEDVDRFRRALRARDRARRANERFRDALAEALSGADLSERMAAPVREDGLREAAADIETDVSF